MAALIDRGYRRSESAIITSHTAAARGGSSERSIYETRGDTCTVVPDPARTHPSRSPSPELRFHSSAAKPSFRSGRHSQLVCLPDVRGGNRYGDVRSRPAGTCRTTSSRPEPVTAFERSRDVVTYCGYLMRIAFAVPSPDAHGHVSRRATRLRGRSPAPPQPIAPKLAGLSLRRSHGLPMATTRGQFRPNSRPKPSARQHGSWRCEIIFQHDSGPDPEGTVYRAGYATRSGLTTLLALSPSPLQARQDRCARHFLRNDFGRAGMLRSSGEKPAQHRLNEVTGSDC